MKGTVEKETNMNIIVKIAAVLVALEFFYILYLETFASSSEKTSNCCHNRKYDETATV